MSVVSTVAAFDRDAIRSLSPEAQRQVVGQFIEQGRNMLAQAIQASDVYGIRDAKGAASTINEMTRQLGLSKDAREDAGELVRRAEYELGKAVRVGQASGTITTKSDGAWFRDNQDGETTKVSPSRFLPEPAERRDVYLMADSVEAGEFEDVLAEAKAEHNVSRANVVRKIKNRKSPQTRDDRAQKIADLAHEGYTSQQIAAKIGLSRDAVSSIVKDYDVDVPADRARGRRSRINSNRILAGVTESLAAAAYSLQQVNPLELDQEEARERVDSLTESLSALRRATRTIKESLHE